MSLIRKVLNPELFQGSLKRRGYFEGWYFKLIDADRRTAAAVIPGVSLGRSSLDSHAFVQFILGGKAEYYRYPLSDFWADERAFRVRVGRSEFNARGVALDLGDGAVTGRLEFSEILPFPKTLLCPGAMGPFGFVPGMQCYHGVVNMNHRISGSLLINGGEASFDGGAGYIEKDWGRAFPSAWVWLQANHFGQEASLLFSVADVPFVRGSFRGFLAFLLAGGRMFQFASYTGARVESLTERSGVTHAVVSSHGLRLEVSAAPGPGGLLKVPSNGLMDRTVEESISASVEVRLTDRSGNTLFQGVSPCAGMERYAAEMLYFS